MTLVCRDPYPSGCVYDEIITTRHNDYAEFQFHYDNKTTFFCPIIFLQFCVTTILVLLVKSNSTAYGSMAPPFKGCYVTAEYFPGCGS